MRSLIDRDLVVPRGGRYGLATTDALDLASIAAPPSLQALLAARLDALTAAQRHVVSVASVLGTTLSRNRIADLCPDVEDIDAVLAQLVHLQILAHQSSRLSSEFGRYSFQQSMFRQVAYGTLSLRDRKKIHLAIVESYGPAEDLSPDNAAVLAQHLLDAMEALPGDEDVPTLRAGAIDLLSRAATRARALGLSDDAVEHLRAALGHADDRMTRAGLQAVLGAALVDTGDYAAAAAVAQEATEVFDDVGDELSAGRSAATWSMALSLSGRPQEGDEVARPRWDRLHGDPDATTTALALSEALISTEHNLRWNPDSVQLLDIRARLAEKAGDVQALADTFAWMSLRHLLSGATTLGMTLLQATAALGREHQLPVPLARALVNLTANAITNDAEEAVTLGQEARTVARRAGVRRWASVSALNLAVAQFVRGEWDALEQMVTSTDIPWESGIDSAAISAIDSLLAWARGRDAAWVGTTPAEADTLPGTDHSWTLFGQAVDAARAGATRQALTAAVAAVEEYGEIFDDFLHMWAVAMDLALATGDHDTETRLLQVVDGAPVVPPLGLRAHRARAGALIAVRDGSEDAEHHLRRAVDLYTEWGALPYRARARAELGSFLAGEGRQDEAEPLLEESREYLTSIGAQAWLEQLDLAPAAVHSP